MSKCPICGSEHNPNLGYCQGCVKQKLHNFEAKLTELLDKYPYISLVAKGPNLIIRHKYGEEIYF